RLSISRWVDQTPFGYTTITNHHNSVASAWNNRVEQLLWPFKMPMLLQHPSNHVRLSAPETDQPLDFTMSNFKTKKMEGLDASRWEILQNGLPLYYNRSNNNQSFTRGNSPDSCSSDEVGVGPPIESPSISPESSEVHPSKDKGTTFTNCRNIEFDVDRPHDHEGLHF
ncbi:hypothetical protein YQE_03939, partial [Dendroctonus ponderosae]